MEFNLETIFWISAVVGSTFFILKTATMFLGLGHDFDLAIDHQSDLHGLDNAGSVMAFKFMSLTGITTFLMMFGWGGLVVLRQYQMSALVSSILAVVLGVLAVLLIAVIFKYAVKLQSSGADYTAKDIIGLHGQVYSQIPANGQGRIQINVGGLVREIDAISAEQVAIASHLNVEVVSQIDPNTVSVKLINNLNQGDK